MKKILTLLFATAITIGATAQTQKMAVGGYGAGTSELTFIDGKAALNIGAYGGVLLNHKWLIGAGGSNIFFNKTINGKKEEFQFNYYGLYSEYRFLPESKLNVTVGVLGGMGWNENKMVSTKGSLKKDGDYTYVIQPKLGLNIKVASFMQIQAYGGYRFTGKTNSINYTSNNHNGANVGIGLVFGAF